MMQSTRAQKQKKDFLKEFWRYSMVTPDPSLCRTKIDHGGYVHNATWRPARAKIFTSVASVRRLKAGDNNIVSSLTK